MKTRKQIENEILREYKSKSVDYLEMMLEGDSITLEHFLTNPDFDQDCKWVQSQIKWHKTKIEYITKLLNN
jgi:hypothetical protein